MGGTTVHASPKPPGATEVRKDLCTVHWKLYPLVPFMSFFAVLEIKSRVSRMMGRSLPLSHGPSSLGSTSSYEMSLLCSPSGSSFLPRQCHTMQREPALTALSPSFILSNP